MSLAIFIAAGCLTCAAVASAVTYYAVNWSRDRQEENDHARRELAIEHGLRLAQENQQLEQQVSGEQPAVEPFMADSGYRPPQTCRAESVEGAVCLRSYGHDGEHQGATGGRLCRWAIGVEVEQAERQCNNGNCPRTPAFAWKRDGFPMAACNLCISLWFEDGLPEWVERIGTEGEQVERNVEGKALAAGHGLHVSRGWDDDLWAPGCGCPLAHCGLVIPQWGCVQHDNGKTFRQAHRVDECPAYAEEGCPWAECPHPDRCDTGCRWGEEANQWADAIHADDDGPETLPRVLPEGQVSD